MIRVFEGMETVTLVLGEHKLVIDVVGDQFFFDGQRIKTTHPEFNYNKGQMFEKNKFHQKKRLLTCKANGKVLAVDVGYDGRTFFKEFSNHGYKVFRHAPEMVWSYWHCRREGLKKWYEKDLSNPKKIWSVKYNKEVKVNGF